MLAADLTRYVEGLIITQGAGIGEPIRLLRWQRDFIRGAFGVQGDASLTVGRGNGKTTLIAGIAAAALDGPLMQPRGEVVCVASSFTQGKIIHEHVRAFLEAAGHDLADRKLWRVQDSMNAAMIEHRPTGARVRTIGSDPKRAHGLAPLLVLADEPAQWEPGKRDAMRAALQTAMGKIPGSRMIALGTRPDDETHWFAKMLDGGCDYAQVHAAGDDDPPFNAKTWRKANPSLPVMPDLAERIRRESQDAKRDPSMFAAFKALRLNLGTADTDRAMLIGVKLWIAAEGDVPREGERIFGVDLGTTAAMSAVACCWFDSGRLEVMAAYPRLPTLRERALNDGAGELYARMADLGELVTLGGNVVPVQDLLAAAMERFGGAPSVILADRWRWGELADALAALGLAVPVLARGQGFKDGAEDVRDFRRSILDHTVRPAKSLLLVSAMREARVVSDPAGNEKLSKASQGGRRGRGRDDAAAAAILAAAHLQRSKVRAEASTEFLFERIA